MERNGSALAEEEFYEATGDAFPLEVEQLSGEELLQMRAATHKEESGRVLEALRLLESLSGRSSPAKNSSNRRRSTVVEAHRRRVHSRIASDLAVAGAALDETEQDGWQLASDGKLRVEYRHQPGTSVHGFRYSTTLEYPALYIVCMGREFDLIKTWNSYIKVSNILSVMSLSAFSLYQEIWLPWPFKNRGHAVDLCASDLLETHRKCLLVRACDLSGAQIEEHKSDGGVPPSQMNAAMLETVQPSSIVLQPLEQELTKVIISVQVNPRILNPPEWLVRFVLRVMSPFVYQLACKMLEKVAKGVDAGAHYVARMRQRPLLYELVRESVENFLKYPERSTWKTHDAQEDVREDVLRKYPIAQPWLGKGQSHVNGSKSAQSSPELRAVGQNEDFERNTPSASTPAEKENAPEAGVLPSRPQKSHPDRKRSGTWRIFSCYRSTAVL